ncbi:hypothetical protein [Marivirga atlantica]|uniref:Cyclic nucleotide-binding domain-containing protein n=1 Tax=Marivirga atlantica TaxID=1548457 RepID=A0A937DLD7_9BACT|nr:hypothetical protein [Marivirga atlantica]MBL0767166.1 hypothetical protein [Marivirga atlantica]
MSKLSKLISFQSLLWFLIFIGLESIFLFGASSLLRSDIAYFSIISILLIILLLDNLLKNKLHYFIRPKTSVSFYYNIGNVGILVFGGLMLFLVYINIGKQGLTSSFGTVGSITLLIALPFVFLLWLSFTRISKGSVLFHLNEGTTSNYQIIEPYLVIITLAIFGIGFDFLPNNHITLFIVPLALVIVLAIVNIFLNAVSLKWLLDSFKKYETTKETEVNDSFSIFEINPYGFLDNIEKVLIESSNDNRIRALYTIKSLAAIDKIGILEELQKKDIVLNDPTSKGVLNDTLRYLKQIQTKVGAIENAYEYVEQSSDIDVIKGLLRLQIDYSDKNLVIKLLNDNRSSVVKAACLVAGHHDDINFISILIERLSNPRVSIYARFALEKIGFKVVKYLEIEFSKNKNNLFFTEGCFEILSKINNPYAHLLLFSSLRDSNKNIIRIAAKKIIDIYKKPPQEKRSNFGDLFNELILNTLSNIFIIRNIKKSNETFYQLKTAFENENKENITLIRKLMQLYYSKEVIDEIFDAYQSDNVHEHNLANNLADLHIDDNLIVLNKIKVLLSPDDSRLREFILEEFPDFEFDNIFDSEESLIWHILNMDYDKVNNWTRACAINTLQYLYAEDIPFELATEFLNENRLMQETAALCIYQNLPEFYSIYLNRLENDKAVKLDFIVRSNIEYSDDQKLRTDNLLLYDKIQFLSSIPYLKELTTNEINTFESFFKPVVLEEGNHQISLNNEDDAGFWIIESGNANFSNNGLDFKAFEKRDIIDVMPSSAQSGHVYFNLDRPARFLVIEKIVLLNILKNSYNIIFDNIQEISDFSSSLQVVDTQNDKVA